MFLEVRIRQRGFVKLPTITIIENISRTMTSARRSRFDKITFYNCDIILTTYFNIFFGCKIIFFMFINVNNEKKKTRKIWEYPIATLGLRFAGSLYVHIFEIIRDYLKIETTPKRVNRCVTVSRKG